MDSAGENGRQSRPWKMQGKQAALCIPAIYIFLLESMGQCFQYNLMSKLHTF
ncbi:hypothetical protein GQ55_1G184200 [Panicum hallii var. hallii]|uniref:Uncharacterized protein n=1 Tax=Panicum hallii var. hallii TaxID=1504633 RepID=A0A2T7F650_9POAL|nr:hypothetical protein GQ55_1G184200 [Panicum hallii var. hallii]